MAEAMTGGVARLVGVVGSTLGFGLVLFGFQTGNALLTIGGSVLTLGAIAATSRELSPRGHER